MKIPFNQTSPVGNEEKYLLESLRSGKWCGRGPKTLELEKSICEKLGIKHAFFVTSCSSAMEVGCIVAGVGRGDEVVIPSFGFVSSANAVLVAGGTPVFADIDPLTWNISRATVEKVLTPKTKAVMPVHYAGSSAGIEELRDLCQERGLFLIEDAAQSLGAKRRKKYIGSTPWVSCFSLHETKNISCGEGGIITTDTEAIAQKIQIVIEKGTNRQRFFRGQVDKYTWVDRGSSYIASDLLAAVALAQFEKLDEITLKRQKIFSIYKSKLAQFEGKVQWQSYPDFVEPNGHVAAFRVPKDIRDKYLSELKEKGVNAVFHYIPLHDAPYAKEKGLCPEKELPHSTDLSESLIRLPIYFGMTDDQIEWVCTSAISVLKSKHG